MRLLILDDDPAIGRTITFIAEGVGAEVRYTSSHVEFFDLQRDWLPTHIAVDLVMPEMDGVQVLARLADQACRARVIITSGLGDRVLAAAGRSAREHGLLIAGTLSKPFSPVILRDLLKASDVGDLPGEAPPGAAREARRAPPAVDPESLARAIRARELAIYVQPKVSCSTLALTGFEALVRWPHPEHGLVMPDRFIALAESHGLIGELTDHVIESSIRWFAGFTRSHASRLALAKRAEGGDAVALSINLSARSLHDAELVERIARQCAEAGVAPEQMVFELTETSAMEDPTASLDLLTRFRLKGFQLSLDDFGTGFSSMLQLVRLPFSEIKVDRSFVMTARQSSESRAVIRSVVDLGHSLGLKSTAEGVEDAEALEYLNAIGCDNAQGFLFARPMPIADVDNWIGGRQAPAAG